MCKIKYVFLILVCITAFIGCRDFNKKTFNPESDPVSGIASVVVLKPGENIINMEDYIVDFSGIDSVYYEQKDYKYDKENHILTINTDFSSILPLSQIIISKEGKIYTIVCRKSAKVKMDVFFIPEEGVKYSEVSIAGDFNSWNPSKHKLSVTDETWKISLTLDQGLYQYQIVADGKWMNNPSAGDTVSNGIGGYNTVLNATAFCNSQNLSLQTISFDSKNITIGASDMPERLVILWQNQVIPINLQNFVSNQYSFQIPEEACKMKRSYIRIFASKSNCMANDLYIPLNNGEVLYKTEDILRSDKFSNIMYFVLVDRFCNGDSANDKKLNDPRVADKANYQGGDLYGVLKKADEGYFEKLGINCLWISPIFRNPDEAYQEYPEPHRYYSGYHGYWPISSTEIDYRLGNDSIFAAIVENVHGKNINIILDFVANHVHEKHPLYQANKDWATQLNLPDGRQNIRLWDEYRLTTWFDTFLPSWDFAKPEVSDTISEYAMYWVAKFGIDGFRHDATKHIPEVFWRLLTKKIKTEYPDKSVYQIGETFGNRELIADYVGSGMMDGQFDFNLYFDARNCFANSNADMKNIALSLTTSLSYYGSNNLMGNITGNHDLTRFISFADGSVLPGEDDKEAGWKRDIQVENKASYKKLQSLTAFTMAIPGVPCIYYGDEIGLPGVGDPDNRRMMKFDNLTENEKETFDIASTLISIRKNNIEFLLGTTIIVDAGSHMLIIKRKYFDREAYIIFNQSDSVNNILISKSEIKNISDFKQNFDSEISELSSNYQIKLNPFSFEILIKKDK
jgi:glycosidase